METGAIEKPLVIFDGDCGFCRFWVEYWRQLTRDRVDYAPFQEAAERFPHIPREAFARSLQMVTPEGWTYGGAAAVFQVLSYAEGYGHLTWLYDNFPLVAPISEGCYAFVAAHRSFSDALRRALWGKKLEPSTYVFTRWIFLRLLGLIYFAAFTSLWPQITGLVGAQGIIPWSTFAQDVAARFGPERYWLLPTLAWLNPADGFLKFLVGAGVALSILIILGIATVPALILTWIVYLSLVTVGRDFLAFQWDALLLEAGFLAIFFASCGLIESHWRRSSGERGAAETPPSKTVIWLLRWLLFRLFFLSGCVKLLSHDPAWRNLTALEYHYHTQPLPTPLAWYVSQLPAWFQKCSVVGVFAIEVFAPFLIFAPRRLRHLGCAALISFQILIALTGNYAYFNLLAVALCLLLLDDAALRRWIPDGLRRRLAVHVGKRALSSRRRMVYAALTVFVVFVSGMQMLEDFGAHFVPQPALEFMSWVEPLRIVNPYGLFAVMTTERVEIILQGSMDGQRWESYSFKYKPGDPKRRPGWVAPYQPRLDWQMWFAALGTYRDNPWFVGLIRGLLDGSPDVLKLLGNNPFPNAPPRYVRALAYDYRFTDFAARRATGDWWQREYKGIYFPPVSLRSE
ncbi:MAG: lipase maturation factor family protein [Terriglobia bacterium]